MQFQAVTDNFHFSIRVNREDIRKNGLYTLYQVRRPPHLRANLRKQCLPAQEKRSIKPL